MDIDIVAEAQIRAPYSRLASRHGRPGPGPDPPASRLRSRAHPPRTTPMRTCVMCVSILITVSHTTHQYVKLANLSLLRTCVRPISPVKLFC